MSFSWTHVSISSQRQLSIWYFLSSHTGTDRWKRERKMWKHKTIMTMLWTNCTATINGRGANDSSEEINSNHKHREHTAHTDAQYKCIFYMRITACWSGCIAYKLWLCSIRFINASAYCIWMHRAKISTYTLCTRKMSEGSRIRW